MYQFRSAKQRSCQIISSKSTEILGRSGHTETDESLKSNRPVIEPTNVYFSFAPSVDETPFDCTIIAGLFEKIEILCGISITNYLFDIISPIINHHLCAIRLTEYRVIVMVIASYLRILFAYCIPLLLLSLSWWPQFSDCALTLMTLSRRR